MIALLSVGLLHFCGKALLLKGLSIFISEIPFVDWKESLF